MAKTPITMQKTIITGNLGDDAEIRETQSGNTVISFSVADTEKWKDKQGNPQSRTIWFKCSYWRNNTAIAQYLTKGTKVYVEGKPNASAYQNNQNDIIVQEGINVMFLELLSRGESPKQTQNNNESGNGYSDNGDPDSLPF